MVSLKSIYRTLTCGELRPSHVGQEVTLSGWIDRKRDHGGVVFLDLRDHYGVTQVVFSGDVAEKVHALRVESVITVTGKVVKRDGSVVNKDIPTGEVEVQGSAFQLISAADVLPFQIAEDDNAPEATRLQYRFLELRRDKLHKNIVLRSRIIQSIREIMNRLGFLEFQTPILTSSSPEGARDFIVPSRLHPGKFFALPQAPQQFKQLLMVSGFDRYFQIAPCFRDEDSRADRSPGEFYQCDLEMSFVEQEDVFQVGDALMTQLFSTYTKKPITPAPFPRIRYDDAMSKYGSDKPDLRNPLEIQDLSSIFSGTEFKVFRGELDKKGGIFGIVVGLDKVPARKYFDDLVAWFTNLSGKGVAYLSFDDGAEVKGSIAKFVSASEVEGLKAKFGNSPAHVVFLGAGQRKEVLPHLGHLRTKLGQDFNLIEDAFRFCWVTDYPMFERDEKTGEIIFSHNPFSMPQGGMDALVNKDPLEIYAYQYDIVCNGIELSSGAIRNHSPDIMYKAFSIAGYPNSVVDEKFGGMIKAFKFGAPPHGGFAPGIDRIVMLLAGENTIREVITFPLAQNAEDLMMGAPSEVSARQLADVHIQIKLPEKVEGK